MIPDPAPPRAAAPGPRSRPWLPALYAVVGLGVVLALWRPWTHTGVTPVEDAIPFPDDAALRAAAADPGVVGRGRELFARQCTLCHGADARGTATGPDLRDAVWLHGDTPAAIARSIRDGYPARGMPAWGQFLAQTELVALTAYVLAQRPTG